MHTKNLVSCTCNSNLKSKFTRKFNSKKKSIIGLLLLLLLAIFFLIISNTYQILNSANNKDNLVADFQLDIMQLRETAFIIDSERKSSNDLQINSFGSDGKLMKSDEITPNLNAALINIADVNNDSKISNEEISSLKIMKLNPDIYKRKLNALGFNLKSADRNLNNYIIITQGQHAGTILYNGPLKFIDNRNKRYFGLVL